MLIDLAPLALVYCGTIVLNNMSLSRVELAFYPVTQPPSPPCRAGLLPSPQTPNPSSPSKPLRYIPPSLTCPPWRFWSLSESIVAVVMTSPLFTEAANAPLPTGYGLFCSNSPLPTGYSFAALTRRCPRAMALLL